MTVLARVSGTINITAVHYAKAAQQVNDWGGMSLREESRPEGLFSEMHSGKTLSQVAEEKGVDLESVQDAVQVARSEAAKEAIQ